MNKQYLLKFAQIALAIAKIQIPAISAVEAAIKAIKGAKTGPQKKLAVMQAIMSAPEILEALKSEEIIDQEMFKSGVAEMNDGLVKVMKSLANPNEPGES